MRTLKSGWQVAICTGLIVCALCAAQIGAQDGEKSPANPLSPFERLIGGQWHLENTYQEFEWGSGKQSVRGRSYQVKDGEASLVSEGLWFYHPGEGEIKGYFVGSGMGVDLIDYTTEINEERMVNDLTSYGTYGGAYEEVWEFTGDDEYVWTLYQKTDDGRKKMMGGTFVRK